MRCPICDAKLEQNQRIIQEWVSDYFYYLTTTEPVAICLTCGWEECPESMELETVEF